METNNHIGDWTAEQLASYADGSLPAEEAHRLEHDMLDDPFLRDAVEGIAAQGTGLDMTSLDEKWQARNPSPSATSGPDTFTSVMIGVAIVGVIGLGITMIQQSQVEHMAEEVSESIEEHATLSEVYADSIEVMEIQLAHVVAVDKEIRAEETKREQTGIKEIEEEFIREKIIAPPAIPPLKYDSMKPEVIKDIVEPSPPIFYVLDLKMTDHREEYVDELYLRGEWLGGTAAIYEREQNGITQIAQLQQVNYQGIMTDAMDYFTARDYKSALLILKKIEKKHPNDANVAFYGGLCYYNLSKGAKADVYFRRALNHTNRVFDQEATWYLSLSLIEQGKDSLARIHLEEIVTEGGFYADRAKALLASRL